MPFYALRRAPPSDGPLPGARGNCLRDWEELTLLTRGKTESEGPENYRLHKAQMLCVVHGLSEWQWVAYAFEDTRHDSEGDENEIENEDVFGHEFNEDPIACGLDANLPIWRPRQYFLKAFEVRIRLLGKEWDKLVHMLEADRNEYVCFLTLRFDYLLSVETHSILTRRLEKAAFIYVVSIFSNL